MMATDDWLPDISARGSVKYRAIVDALADAIERGDLRPGDRLPTHRDLAWALGVNVSTVSEAYREAKRRHLIDGEVGRGTYVLADSTEAALFSLKQAETDDLVDLSTILPAVDPAWVVEDFAPATSALVGYQQPDLLERTAVAASRYLAARGLPVRPSAVVPVAGAQQALLAALLMLAGPGAKVLTEDLTFPGIKAVARVLRITLVPVAMDARGVLPEALAIQARRSGARIAVFVPNLQNPTGSVMDAARRHEVAEVMRAHALTLIEDDAYGGLTDTPPLARELPEQTLVVSSLSKAVAPGLRFGFLAGPPALVRPLRSETHLTSWPASPAMLELGCRWIEDGVVSSRMAWQRSEIAARWRLALDRLGLSAGDVQSEPAPHMWLPIKGNADDVAARARAAGVEVVPASTFAVGRIAQQGLRLGLTTPSTRRRLSVGLERLASVL